MLERWTRSRILRLSLMVGRRLYELSEIVNCFCRSEPRSSRRHHIVCSRSLLLRIWMKRVHLLHVQWHQRGRSTGRNLRKMSRRLTINEVLLPAPRGSLMLRRNAPRCLCHPAHDQKSTSRSGSVPFNHPKLKMSTSLSRLLPHPHTAGQCRVIW
jgi:hypothetical protein